MALRINTNVAALNAHRNLSNTDAAESKNMEKLSSGFRINHASDDAAGLSIANRLRTNVKSLTVASRNATEAKSMVSVAEGAANQIESILERLKELGTQAASDNASTDRDKITAEKTALISEIDRIANDTEYQGTKLITGTFGNTFDATTSTADGVTGLDATGINIGGASAGTYTIAQTAGGDITISTATQSQTIAAANVSSGAQTLTFNALGISLTTNGSFVKTGQALDAKTIVVAAGTGGTFQIGSGDTSTEDQISVSFGNLTSGATGLNVASIDFSTRANASSALTTIDNAINMINTKLGDMGAATNRMDYAYANLKVSIENFSASESVIRDVDMASEMVSFTKNQILMQAGTAMLAQANTASQNVLTLLR